MHYPQAQREVHFGTAPFNRGEDEEEADDEELDGGAGSEELVGMGTGAAGAQREGEGIPEDVLVIISLGHSSEARLHEEHRSSECGHALFLVIFRVSALWLCIPRLCMKPCVDVAENVVMTWLFQTYTPKEENRVGVEDQIPRPVHPYKCSSQNCSPEVD